MIAASLKWIAADWGSSNLRLWALGSNKKVLAYRELDCGAASLCSGHFEPAFLSLVEDWLEGDQQVPVFICGMAGSAQGWVEAKYAHIPCAPISAPAVIAPTSDPRIKVHILPGLCQAEPADVMRGEETLIAGFLAQHPYFEGSVCLPGTHAKWVRVSDGKVVAFQTFMTGELFALLSKQSMLRHEMVAAWDPTLFGDGISASMASPESLSALLFTVRANALLQANTEFSGQAYLSGLLIGLELAGAKPYWQGQSVVLIGESHLCERYSQALALQSCFAQRPDEKNLVLAALFSVYQTLYGEL